MPVFSSRQATRHLGRVARPAHKNPALAYYRAAERPAAELGDPFDVFRGGQIDFPMAIFFRKNTNPAAPSRFGGDIAPGLSTPRRPIGGTHDGCRDDQRQEDAAGQCRSPKRNSGTNFLNPVEGCDLAFIDIFPFMSGVVSQPQTNAAPGPEMRIHVTAASTKMMSDLVGYGALTASSPTSGASSSAAVRATKGFFGVLLICGDLFPA